MPRMRMRQAIARAMADELAADADVIVLGEDVGAAGGVFKTSEGLQARFGPQRVRDTPIAEMGFLGAAVGAAMTGLRPIVEIMFMDFLGVALDQLVTQAAKMRFLSAGQYSVPLVVRGSAGSGLGYAAQHSQAVEPWLLSTAGLTVAMASSPSTAYGLLRAAVRDPDPVVVIEPRSLYPVWEDFDPEQVEVSLGRARTLRAGTDVTLVAAGTTVGVAQAAADEASGFSAEVIDLLTLNPLDLDTVRASVARTGRLVTVESGPEAGGWGAALAARVAAECFGTLRSPVLRLTAPAVPVPYAESLERLLTPAPADVVAQVEALLSKNSLPDPWWSDPR